MSTEWSSALSIGIPEIDAQHQTLLELLNEVEREASRESASFDVIDDVFERLESYIATHFRDEEALMESIGYEFLAQHRQQHRDLTAQVHEFRRDFSTGQIEVRFLHSWLLRWLVSHIAGSDTLIASSLQKHRGGRASPADF